MNRWAAASALHILCVMPSLWWYQIGSNKSRVSPCTTAYVRVCVSFSADFYCYAMQKEKERINKKARTCCRDFSGPKALVIFPSDCGRLFLFIFFLFLKKENLFLLLLAYRRGRRRIKIKSWRRHWQRAQPLRFNNIQTANGFSLLFRLLALFTSAPNNNKSSNNNNRVIRFDDFACKLCANSHTNNVEWWIRTKESASPLCSWSTGSDWYTVRTVDGYYYHHQSPSPENNCCAALQIALDAAGPYVV